MNKWMVGITVLAVVALVTWRLLGSQSQDPFYEVAQPDSSEESAVMPERQPEPGSPAGTATPEPEITAPLLPANYSEPYVEQADPLLPTPEQVDSSDDSFRAVSGDLAPAVTAWLMPEEQLRKWVLVVDLVADGKLPKRYLPLSYTMPGYAVRQTSGRLVPSEANHARVGPLVDALVGIDPPLLQRYYRAWYPLLEQAYAEQGKPGTFHQRLLLALDNMLNAGPAPAAPALKRPHVFYQYADEELEARSEVEKWFWRQGDAQRVKLQDWLRSIRKGL